MCMKHWSPGPGEARAGQNLRTPSERHAAMRWAQRLKRVFGIDVQTCAGRCGGDQGDLCAPGGQSTPGACTAATTRPGAACAGLRRFIQRYRIKRIFLLCRGLNARGRGSAGPLVARGGAAAVKKPGVRGEQGELVWICAVRRTCHCERWLKWLVCHPHGCLRYK
jgi:hypothetical protein